MLKILRKHISCGSYEFDVCINRDIAVRALEEFPDLSEYVFTNAKENAKTKNVKNIDEFDILLDNIRKKKTSELYKQEENLRKCVEFAFPLMLKVSGSDIDVNEFIAFVTENNVDDEFFASMYEFILLGFTQREVIEQRKVNFSMK